MDERLNFIAHLLDGQKMTALRNCLPRQADGDPQCIDGFGCAMRGSTNPRGLR
jgi:hypothetical protein